MINIFKFFFQDVLQVQDWKEAGLAVQGCGAVQIECQRHQHQDKGTQLLHVSIHRAYQWEQLPSRELLLFPIHLVHLEAGKKADQSEHRL